MLDLELFGRVLRLRWLWYEWTEPDRPWVGTEVSCTDIDKQFFRASTEVFLGQVLGVYMAIRACTKGPST
jgi:hypothetical protein